MILSLSSESKAILALTVKIIISLSLLSIPFSTTSQEEDGIITTSSTYQVTNYLINDRSSLRIFRGIAEMSFMVLCGALCLYVLERNLGRDILNVLVFGRYDDNGGEELFGLEEGSGVIYRLDDIVVKEEKEDSDDKKKSYSDYAVVVVEGKEKEEEDDDNNNEDDEKEEEESESEDEEEEVIQLLNKEGRVETAIKKDNEDEVASTSLNVANAGMDIILLLSTSLLIYTQHMNHNDLFPSLNSSFFPLMLFIVFLAICIFPWNKSRKIFWLIVFRTIQAPILSVTFRDGLIGDIFTSSVRPLQDLSYGMYYLLSGLNAEFVEQSWILYTCVLPACTVSPLWWRFLQNLRQAYDSRKRWPYLGNAFKYFIAAEVALFGLFIPGNIDSGIWISCFVIATLYQIWWDTFMDWELFDNISTATTIKGVFTIRKTRLYSYTTFYYFVFALNVLLRFCWTLSFIPPQTLSRAGLLAPTFSSDADFANVINPALASAEIIRRTLWTLLRVELQAIKQIQTSTTATSSSSKNNNQKSGKTNNMEKEEEMDYYYNNSNDLHDMSPMSIESISSTSSLPSYYSTMFQSVQPFSIFQTTMAINTEVQVLTELALWATAFASLGIIAAAHRE